MPTGIHPTAIIHDGAEIGADATIGPFCVIGPRTRIGDRCRLQSHVVVDGDTWLGSDCEVFPFASLGTRPQDKKLETDFVGTLRIGGHNEIRENVTVHGGTQSGRGITEVGDHNMLLAGSHVGHDAHVGSRVIFTNGAMAAGHTVVQDDVILGAMVGIHQFARVGAHAMIGAGAMLSHDAPPFALVQGDRARIVSVNKVGLDRQGFSADQIKVIKRVYRLLFWRDGVVAKRIAEAKEFAGDDPHVQSILDFVATSKRGICAVRRRASGGDESTHSGD